MTIDNRVFVLLIFPFLILAIARLFWFFAGLPWEPDAFGISSLFIAGITLTFLLALVLFAEGISLGKTRIFSKETK